MKPPSRSPAAALMFLTYALAGAGFFLAGLDGTADGALEAITVLSVGCVGVLSFLRHAVFARSDAARMGWGAEGASNFQLEVGFANLAFGVAALLAWAGDWGLAAEAAVTFGYGLYLLQAALLHLRNHLRDRELGGGAIARLLAIFVMAGGLIYVALNAAADANGSVAEEYQGGSAEVVRNGRHARASGAISGLRAHLSHPVPIPPETLSYRA